MSNKEPKATTPLDTASKDLQEANTCIALGAGVGALGFGAGAIVGVVCPLCYIVPPALIGAGVVKRHLAKKNTSS